MKKYLILAALSWLMVTPFVKADETTSVDYARDIAPIFRQNCVACHNNKKAEGGLDLESYDALMKGGDSGAAVTAKNFDDSYLLSRVTGAEEPWMPPDDNTVGAKRLTEKEVELIRGWIAAGAAQSQNTTQVSIHWGLLPENLKPVYAMATSSDGQHLAFGRGNSVSVTSQNEQQPEFMESLVDPSIPDAATNAAAGVAHLDIVQSVAFSPDSQRLATGGYRCVKIWKKKTTPQVMLDGLASAERVAAVSPDGKRIAYRAGGRSLVLVDLEAGQAHRFLKAHAAPVTALVWGEDNSQLISCDESGQWLLTDALRYQTQPIVLPAKLIATSLVRTAPDRIVGLSTTSQVFELQFTAGESSLSAFVRLLEHTQPVTAIAVTRDAGRFAVALSDGTVLISEAASGKLVQEIKTAGEIESLCLNTDGSLLLTSPPDGAAKIWKTDDGSLLAELNRDYVMSQQVQFASRNISRQQMLIELLNKRLPDLEKVAQTEVEARNKLKETRDKAAETLVAKKQEQATADAGLSEARQALTQAEAALEAAKKMVAEVSAQVQAKEKAVADAANNQLAAEQDLDKREQALAAADAGVTRAQEAIPVFKDRITGEESHLTEMNNLLASLEADQKNQPGIVSIAFSSDGSQAVVAGEDNTLRVFSTVDGNPTANLGAPSTPRTLLAGKDGSLTGLTADGTVAAWDLGLHWELEQTIGNYQDSPISDRVTALDFSPDGKLLAVGSGPPTRFGEIKLFDVRSGQVARDLGQAHSDTVLGLKFSPDGKQLASAAADKLCRLFDVESGEMLRAFEGHTHHVLCVAWHENGQTLATASADASIKLWNAETGEQIRTIGGFSKEVTSLAFVSPSKNAGASQIVSASADGVVRVHDAENGKQIKVMSGTSDALYGVVTLHNDELVSAGGQGGKVWTWRLADAKLLGELPAQPR